PHNLRTRGHPRFHHRPTHPISRIPRVNRRQYLKIRDSHLRSFRPHPVRPPKDTRANANALPSNRPRPNRPAATLAPASPDHDPSSTLSVEEAAGQARSIAARGAVTATDVLDAVAVARAARV